MLPASEKFLLFWGAVTLYLPGPPVAQFVLYWDSEEKQVAKHLCAATASLYPRAYADPVRWIRETKSTTSAQPVRIGQQVFGIQHTFWFLHNTGLLPFRSEQTSFLFRRHGVPASPISLNEFVPLCTMAPSKPSRTHICIPWQLGTVLSLQEALLSDG